MILSGALRSVTSANVDENALDGVWGKDWREEGKYGLIRAWWAEEKTRQIGRDEKTTEAGYGW